VAFFDQAPASLAPAVHADSSMTFALPRTGLQDGARIKAVQRAAAMRGWGLVEESHEGLVLQITTDFRQRHARIRIEFTDSEMNVELMSHENLGKRKVSKDYNRWIELLYADTIAWLTYIEP